MKEFNRPKSSFEIPKPSEVYTRLQNGEPIWLSELLAKGRIVESKRVQESIIRHELAAQIYKDPITGTPDLKIYRPDTGKT